MRSEGPRNATSSSWCHWSSRTRTRCLSFWSDQPGLSEPNWGCRLARREHCVWQPSFPESQCPCNGPLRKPESSAPPLRTAGMGFAGGQRSKQPAEYHCGPAGVLSGGCIYPKKSLHTGDGAQVGCPTTMTSNEDEPRLASDRMDNWAAANPRSCCALANCNQAYRAIQLAENCPENSICSLSLP